MDEQTAQVMALVFDYDAALDILTVEGRQYSGQLFRAWAQHGMPTGQLFRFVETWNDAGDSSTITIERVVEQAVQRLVEDGDRLRAELLGEPCWAVAWGPSGDGPDRYSTIGGQGPECGKCPSCLRRARAALAAHTEPASKEGAATAHQEVTG